MPAETLLVLDEDPQILHVTVRILTCLGYTTLQARTGSEAIALSKSHPGEVHLLRIDAQLPGVTGATVAKQAVDLRPSLRVLLMSGERNGSGPSLLGKPFTLQELQEAVRAALDAPG